ncbi:orotidine-5'-phosphate decarboxylase [Bacteroidota bacterium]
MTQEGLYQQIHKKQSFLCVGLDTDVHRIPAHLQKSPAAVLDFNRAIIDVTHDLTIAYKPNLAFYESRGATGWKELALTVEYIRSIDPEIFLIADAKRGDIGNTAGMYARTFFEELDFDAVTISPYMGRDSVEPFLEYDGKWVILLGLTSNPGAEDFQFLPLKDGGKKLYQEVIQKASQWAGPDRMMFVAGATRAELISRIREIIPDHFLLVPGIGAQGGSLDEVVKAGMNDQCGLIVNSSRSILYADNSESFAEKARANTLELQQAMSGHLSS